MDKKVMLKKYTIKEVANSILLAIFLIGLLLMLYSTYQYFDIENQFADIAEERAEIGEAAQQFQDTGNTTGGIPLASRDLELRSQHNELVNDQDNAVKRGGLGIVLLAASWIIFDLVKSRRKKADLPTEESIEKPA
jgi:hypothetical protein